jgi:P pilus assembly chaperone PapD
MKNRARLLILICLLILACAVAITVYGYWANEPVPGPFTSTEEITYTSYRWGTNDGSVTLTVENTGPMNLTIASIQVDGVTQATNVSPNIGSGLSLAKAASQTFNITKAFTSGIQYNFTVVTAKGNKFGPYTLTAP